MIRIRRIYDSPPAAEGTRVLVDRLWPRGIRKDDLAGATWLKAVAPSDALRRWFGHDPKKWPEFQRRYRGELDAHPEAWQPLLDAAHQGPVTLLYGAKDTERNHAVVLQDYLASRLGSRPRGRPTRRRREARHG